MAKTSITRKHITYPIFCEIKQMLEVGVKESYIAKQTGVSYATVRRIDNVFNGIVDRNSNRLAKLAERYQSGETPDPVPTPQSEPKRQERDTLGLSEVAELVTMKLNTLSTVIDSFADRMVELDDMLVSINDRADEALKKF